MTHEDKGHYAAKHPEGLTPNPDIAERVLSRSTEGRISCASAHEVAGELNVPPADIGVVIDLLELRINQCQLGLFGTSHSDKPVEPASDVPADLEKALSESTREGRISCSEIWAIAKTFGMLRIEACAACEALKVKVTACQLGAF